MYIHPWDSYCLVSHSVYLITLPAIGSESFTIESTVLACDGDVCSVL